MQQIKDRLSIIDVVAPYVELHKAGKNLKGKSPFTNEKTPSFFVSPDRGMYYCFSTSQGGDIFTFVEKMEGVDFKGALKILADKAGVELVPEDPKKRDERDTAYAILEEATQFFENELAKNDAAQKYLKERVVKDATKSKWRLGYAPGPPKHGWRHLKDYLNKKGYQDAELMQAGLIKSAGEGKQPYDVFRDRVMFPIFDPSGRVVAFSGRILTKDSEAPKYVNSPETELFKKSEILYGYHSAKEGIRKLGFSLIVEGQFDVVLAYQAGYTNTVAVSGTALTPHHVSLLQRLSDRVVLALDADRAGIAAVKRAAELMLTRGIDLKVANLPDGKDPADLIVDDIDKLKAAIGEAKHVIEFLLAVLKAEAKDDRSYKLLVRDEVLPYLLHINSHIDRDHFASVVAEATDTTKDAILLDLSRLGSKAVESNRVTDSSNGAQSNGESSKNVARRLDSLRDYLLVAAALVPAGEADVLKRSYQEITSEDFDSQQAIVPKEVYSRLSFTIEEQLLPLKPTVRQAKLAEILNEFANYFFKEAISAARQELAAAESAGDEKTAATKLKAIHDWQQKLVTTPYSVESFG